MKKLFAVLVIGSLTIVGCEKPVSTKAPKVAASEADKAKAIKEGADRAKMESEKGKMDADKKAPDTKDADKGKTDADKKAPDTKDPKKDK